jgi:CsoR family transcriptional regulator, copper-sensing transcriptional repressor
MHADKPDVLRRLASIQGHLQGIRKMVENDEYCVDILKQTHAVKRAIDKLEGAIVSEHLAGCVVSGVENGRGDDTVRELNEIFELSRK